MNDWQTIDSAPRDGTPVLIRQGFAVSTALWRDVYKHKWVIPTDEGWLECTWIIPTHWSPLPGPLEQTATIEAPLGHWYHTTDLDGVWNGKCTTREEAIAEGRGEYEDESFYVAWATNPPIKLSEWVETDRILERADDELSDSDRVNCDFDDSGIFVATPEQERDLAARIKKACDEWQVAHGLVFTVNTFADMGEPELIKAEREASA